jgi:predicted lipoprotein
MAKTAGSYTYWGITAEFLSWVLLALIVTIAVIAPSACDSGQSGDDTNSLPDGVEISAVLADVGPIVVIPTLERFRQSVETLRAGFEVWAAATENGEVGTSELEDVQDAFFAAMVIWQEAEVHQIGPSFDRRDEVYSFPTINPCRIDQETTEAAWNDTDFYDANNVNSYGLDAIEHLLFAPEDNACPNQVNPNKDGSWDALGSAGIRTNRAQFGVALSQGLLVEADTLLNAWKADGGNFSAALASAGDNAPYESELKGLNAVYDAIFYLETDGKDRKLALPMGLRDCDGADCADEVEGRASGQSIRWIEANVEGFWSLYTGGDGAGMDDLLEELGHADLALAFEEAYTTAIDVFASMTGRLDDIIRNSPEDSEAIYAALKGLTDLIKGDLATVLTLEIPKEAAGDND